MIDLLVLGPTAIGKTTLINMLRRQLDASAPAAVRLWEVHGRTARDVATGATASRDVLHSGLRVVLQPAGMGRLHSSIAIGLAQREINDVAVVRAVKTGDGRVLWAREETKCTEPDPGACPKPPPEGQRATRTFSIVLEGLSVPPSQVAPVVEGWELTAERDADVVLHVTVAHGGPAGHGWLSVRAGEDKKNHTLALQLPYPVTAEMVRRAIEVYLRSLP